MTITRGEPWGSVGPPPAGLVVVASNRELFDVVNRHRAAGEPIPPLGLLGGDLCRAVGGTGDAGRFARAEVALLPIDLLRVQVGNGEPARTFWAAAHVAVRRSWWRGPVVVVMNAQFLGRWDVAPRSHPNDGRADVVELDASMPVAQRWKAWRRLPTGAHLPHPKLRTRQVRDAVLPEVPGGRLYADGHRLDTGRLGRGTPVRVTVEPDAALVCV
jgi:hypothetical protein